MTPLPQLVHMASNGGTVHKYQLSGGKRQFIRYIGCNHGSCMFFEDVDQASKYIQNVQQ